MTAPAARMRSKPIFQFHSVRELTASDATWTIYPSRRAAERGLGHADVALHAAEQQRVALAGQTLEHAAKNVAAETGEERLVDGFGSGEQRCDLRARFRPALSHIAC